MIRTEITLGRLFESIFSGCETVQDLKRREELLLQEMDAAYDIRLEEITNEKENAAESAETDRRTQQEPKGVL